MENDTNNNTYQTFSSRDEMWCEFEFGFFSVQEWQGRKYLMGAADLDDVHNNNFCEVEDLTDLSEEQYLELSEMLHLEFGHRLDGKQGRINRETVSWFTVVIDEIDYDNLRLRIQDYFESYVELISEDTSRIFWLWNSISGTEDGLYDRVMEDIDNDSSDRVIIAFLDEMDSLTD